MLSSSKYLIRFSPICKAKTKPKSVLSLWSYLSRAHSLLFTYHTMGQQTSQPKITAQDKAIYQLKRQRDNLKQYQRKLNVVIDRQTELAKQALKDGKIDKAKLYLRLKKHQQSVINTTYDQLGNLENLIGTIEFKLIEKDVVYGLSQGNEVLKKLNNEMSVEKIDKVLDDLEEERLRVDEVSDLLGSGLSNSEENEVEEELERLEREVWGKAPEQQNTEDVSKVPQMPDVPTELKDTPQQAETEDELPEEERTRLEPLPA